MTVLSENAAALLHAGDTVTEADGKLVGGKAIGLARLLGTGARVPEWSVVTIEAFDAHLRSGRLPELYRGVAAATTDAERAAAATVLREAIVESPVDAELTDAVTEFMRGRGPIAVRSSAVGEDGADRSYAGIFESYLFRTEAEQVLDAIRRCWASAFSARALHYRGDSEPAAPEVAVILQDMADGEVSGVMFTGNPITGRMDEALISACWGLGEGIVSGACATDEFVLSHSGSELTTRIADKDVEYIRDAAGGVREQPIDGDRRTRRCLTPEQTSLLVREGVRIATALGGPQDIEWTVRGGEIVVLQTRPITAAATAADPAALGTWRAVWDNSNIQESFNGVTSPLTFSWAARVYEVIFTETLRMIGVREPVIAAHDQVLRNMVGLVSGRVYYNIENWYRVLSLAPYFRRNKEDVERMIGVENPVDFIEGIHPGLRERLLRLPQLLPVVAVLGWRMANRGALVDRFQQEVGAEVDRIRRAQATATDLRELLELADQGLRLFGRWSVQMINDLYLSNQAGRARRLLAKDGTPVPEEVVARLLASEEAVESLQPTVILMRLAGRIRTDAALREAVFTGDPRTGYDAVREASPAVRRVLDDYIELYGDRCMGEQKLETVSLRQDPSFIVTVLRNYVNDNGIDADELERTHRARQEVFEREVLDTLPAARRTRLITVLRKARRAVRDRERVRLTRTRIIGVGRSVYLRIGELLAAAGQLDAPGHVFYLTMEEIQAFAEGRSMTSDLGALARNRIAEFARYELVEPPNQFETTGPPSLAVDTAVPDAAVADSATLRGTGCWPGIVEGDVQIVMSPEDDLDVTGKILTTRRTDPGWGPLFPSVKGLLIERGSTLSHSAVLARELGIPAVVGVPGLMSIVRDGERVRLDGGSGVVQRLDWAGES
ncbi:phosphoenolpyruvate synthase [Nocardia sp. NPDC052001]|uniref:phosphoenolpyruvate synthase n=1 Tax=Nocardia sp. NPDC052001 TaxID=3154853 RepID=UPI00343E0CC6